MSYDEARLRSKLDDALAEFMRDDDLIPGTRDAVVAYVTEAALVALRFLCGDPSRPAPNGLLGYPVKVHPPCADPTCVLCTGQYDIVFGKPSRFHP